MDNKLHHKEILPRLDRSHKEGGDSFSGCSDAEVWKAFKRGNSAAFIYIYDTFFDPVYAYCRQFTSDEELIKDCLQDLFIDINQSKQRLADTNNILLYLFKSAKRSVIKKLKQQKHFKALDREADGIDFEISIEEEIIRQQLDEENLARLRNAVNALTPRQREAIFYLYYHKFSYQEIGELMGIHSVKATQNLIYRAIKELRQIILITFLLNWISIKSV